MRRLENDPSATDRAKWLADLAGAIDDAQRVAWRLGVLEGNNPEATALYFRLESARLEVEALRRHRWPNEAVEFSPIWIQSLLEGSDLLSPEE